MTTNEKQTPVTEQERIVYMMCRATEGCPAKYVQAFEGTVGGYSIRYQCPECGGSWVIDLGGTFDGRREF